MIREIKNYIKERSKVSLSDLKIHFKIDESALIPILKTLEKKQNIIIEKKSCGAGCASCECKSDAINIFYVLIRH